jgi:Tfp pilus assembly protein PilF
MNIQRVLKITFLLTATVALAGCQSGGARVKSGPTDQDTARARDQNNRAFELIKQGKYAPAEELLKKAVAADVMYGPARNNLGLVYYHTNRLYLAAWEFENAIRLMPHQPEPRNNLGLVLERAGQLAPAAESYAQARDIEPDNPEFLANLARAKVRHGDRDSETKKLLEDLVLKDPRPQWNDWARMNLLRIQSLPPTATGPATGD